MEDNIKPVVISGYNKDDKSPIVVHATTRSSSQPVVVEKKKTNIRSLKLEPYRSPDVRKMKLAAISENLRIFFKTKGYQMNTARSMALIASMVSSRLIFLNSKDEDKAQLLCEFFGCMPNFTLGSKLRVIETTDILPALYSARINKDVVSIIFLKIKSKNSLELFRGHITNTYNYNYFKVNCIVNERTTTGFTIPENVWIFVFVEDDHQYDLRKYGSYAKLPTEVTSITYSEHVKPSYTSIKDAFLDLGSIDEDVWSMLDDIISVLEKEGYEFTNKELNMIDDYLVSLLEMGMDYQLAIDFTVINKISYITGDEAIGALKNYKNINILTHTKKKAGKY